MNELRGKVIEDIAMHILICFKILQYITVHKLQLSRSPGGGGGQVNLFSMKTPVKISIKSLFQKKLFFLVFKKIS